MRIAVWLTHPTVRCWRFGPAQREYLAQALPNAEIAVFEDAQALKQKGLTDAELCVAWAFKQEWFALAPRLRWVVTPAAGRDYFQVSPPSGVRVLYSSFHGRLMAETVLAMMLSTCRGVLASQRLQRQSAWWQAELETSMRPLRGSHVVILGLGHIGTWVGRLAKPLGVRLTGVKRAQAAPPDYFDHTDQIVTIDQLDPILQTTDHLVLALPSGAATDNLLNEERLRLLPSRAVVYNVGRGNAIHEAALVAALRQGRLAGACLDVFQEEPLPLDSPLRTCPNVLLTPHASAISPNYLDLFVDELAARVKSEWNIEY